MLRPSSNPLRITARTFLQRRLANADDLRARVGLDGGQGFGDHDAELHGDVGAERSFRGGQHRLRAALCGLPQEELQGQADRVTDRAPGRGDEPFDVEQVPAPERGPHGVRVEVDAW